MGFGNPSRTGFSVQPDPDSVIGKPPGIAKQGRFRVFIEWRKPMPLSSFQYADPQPGSREAYTLRTAPDLKTRNKQGNGITCSRQDLLVSCSLVECVLGWLLGRVKLLGGYLADC